MTAGSGDQIPVRHDIWKLEGEAQKSSGSPWDPITLAYARAVGEMQNRPVSDPTSWTYQANIHGTYDPVPPGADWNQCQHASWFFLPWHRMYIFWFEQIVRSIVTAQGGPADWALPYWNYNNPYPWNTLPPAFREQKLPDGSPNPLYVAEPHRNATPAPGINGGAQLPPVRISFQPAFKLDNFLPLAPFTPQPWNPNQPPPPPSFGGGPSQSMQFEGFTGGLENQPHNIVHSLVGGSAYVAGGCDGTWMNDPQCAARDPIFYLHHSNIDRLWTNWLKLGGKRRNPDDWFWLTQQWTFYDQTGTRQVLSIEDILDPTDQSLQYRYDDAASLPAQPAQAPEPPPTPALAASVPPGGTNPPTLLAASSGPIELGNRPAAVSIGLAPQVRETVNLLTAAAPESLAASPPPRIQLNVEGVQVEQRPESDFAVYLNLPEDGSAATPEEQDPYFVGLVTFFAASHHHGARGSHFAYDITDVVHHLATHGQWDPENARVSFLPVTLLPPPGAPQATEEPAALAAEPVSEPAVRIGRVSISSR